MTMFQQEINEWVEENCRVTGVLNKHRKFDRHDQLINCDIPSQIINEVEQHWFIVAVKKAMEGGRLQRKTVPMDVLEGPRRPLIKTRKKSPDSAHCFSKGAQLNKIKILSKNDLQGA